MLKSILRPVLWFFLRIRTKYKISNLIQKSKNINLEIGSGQKKGKGDWVTMDMEYACDLYWDLRFGIPFPDGTIDKIYSSHLFEHLTFKEAQILLKECKRVLKKGGVFLICVPNAKIYIDAYYKSNESISSTKEQPTFYAPAFNDSSSIDWLNYIAYMDGHHKYMFDETNLLAILTKATFTNVKVRAYDPELDRIERDFESLYAQGTNN